VLFYWPRAYDLVHSQVRSEVYYRLGVPHDPGFRALRLLDRGPSPLVLDVGANIGQSIYSIKAMLPGARVISFEPNPDNVVRLRRLAGRLPAVSVESVGLGAQDLTRELHIPRYRSKRMTALASLDWSRAAGWLNSRSVFWFDKDRLEMESVSVTIRPLDTYHLNPDFIKIDTEGADDSVLSGALRTIVRSRPVIMAETLRDTGAARDLVSRFGYMFAAFDGMKFTPSSFVEHSFLVPGLTPDGRVPSPPRANPPQAERS